MKKWILSLMLMLVLPAAAIACPGAGDGKRGGHFQSMDSNGDGVVSAEEHAAMAAERFATMDGNGDGKVTTDEMQTHRKEMRKQWKKDGKNCPMKGGQGRGMGKGNCPKGNDCPRMQGS